MAGNYVWVHARDDSCLDHVHGNGEPFCKLGGLHASIYQDGAAMIWLDCEHKGSTYYTIKYNNRKDAIKDISQFFEIEYTLPKHIRLKEPLTILWLILGSLVAFSLSAAVVTVIEAIK